VPVVALEIRGLLDDKYEILKRLATGGMGDVYLVSHRHLQERRVVKVLRTDLTADEAARQRFQQEARVATQIKHPNVAILYDYSLLPDGRYYMVWEYIEGEDLSSRIKKGPVPPDQAIELTVQALRGLDAIHSAGVIHRDISPDNLMVTRDLRGKPLLKIIDLGLAKDIRPDAELELTQAGAFLGKFQYCSPEQAGYLKDEPLDARSDLYSLAQVLYEAVTGLPPFDSESQHGFVLKRLTELPVPLRKRNPKTPLPAALEAVVMKGLALHRDDRFADAREFIQALRRVAEGMREVSTQELSAAEVRRAIESQSGTGAIPTATRPIPPGSSSGGGPAAPRTSGQSQPGNRPAGNDSTGTLSREDRQALLARIEKAASRVQEGGQALLQADAALKDGRFEEARKLVRQLEAVNPAPRGLADLKRRLQEAEEIARRRQQVLQAEQMLEKYLLERQQTLASLALETLLDLYPNHPKRDDYQAWVGLLANEAEQQKRAERAFADGRAAVARGDVAGARRLLEEVERLDLTGKLAGSLLNDINEAQRDREQGEQAARVRQRFDQALVRGAVDDASRELDVLASLEVTKVTLDPLRGQVEEAKSRRQMEEAATTFERGYRDAVARHDWFAAREMARQMEEAVPGNPRPRQMLAELARLQEVDQKLRAIAEGLKAFDGYLQSSQLPQAELALKVLRQMGGDDPRVADAEKRFLKARG
jgi:serine/threonine protein kinase